MATLNIVADQAVQAVEEKINIDIYFKPEVDEQDVITAQVWLQSIPEVKSVRYVSRDEALEKFKASHANNPNIAAALAELTDNPLPASLVIQAYALQDYAVITQQFEASQYDTLVQDKNFSDHQLVIERLSSIIRRLYQGALVVSLIFIIISVIMMFNTVRVAIYAHREELGIMKLVGATNWFVRAPFILEGLVYALVSSSIAMVLLWITMAAATPYVNNFFTGYNFSLSLFFQEHFWYIFAFQVVVSIVLAVGSSMLSIGRYLRV